MSQIYSANALEGERSMKNEIHQSHDMSKWENTIITITSTPRFGKIRVCKKCGAEQAETVCGVEIQDELQKPCW